MPDGVNKVILVGNLGADPEVRFTPSGQAVANFRIATSENWTDKSGQKQERTEWHRIVVWGKLGELCGEYLAKGRQCYVEGRLQTREWNDKEGKKNYTTEVVANNVVFLGGRGEVLRRALESFLSYVAAHAAFFLANCLRTYVYSCSTSLAALLPDVYSVAVCRLWSPRRARPDGTRRPGKSRSRLPSPLPAC